MTISKRQKWVTETVHDFLESCVRGEFFIHSLKFGFEVVFSTSKLNWHHFSLFDWLSYTLKPGLVHEMELFLHRSQEFETWKQSVGHCVSWEKHTVMCGSLQSSFSHSLYSTRLLTPHKKQKLYSHNQKNNHRGCKCKKNSLE